MKLGLVNRNHLMWVRKASSSPSHTNRGCVEVESSIDKWGNRKRPKAHARPGQPLSISRSQTKPPWNKSHIHLQHFYADRKSLIKILK